MRASWDRLWADLAHGEVSGVEVLRMRHASGARAITAMPVTFASALHVGEPRPQAGEWLRRMGPRTMQTPQVWLDHQGVPRRASTLVLNWDAVGCRLPSRSAAADARRYVDLLVRLADRGLDGAGARLETGRDVDPFRTGVHGAGRGAPEHTAQGGPASPIDARDGFDGAAVAKLPTGSGASPGLRMVGRDATSRGMRALSLGVPLTAIRPHGSPSTVNSGSGPGRGRAAGPTIRDLAANLPASGDAP